MPLVSPINIALCTPLVRRILAADGWRENETTKYPRLLIELPERFYWLQNIFREFGGLKLGQYGQSASSKIIEFEPLNFTNVCFFQYYIEIFKNIEFFTIARVSSGHATLHVDRDGGYYLWYDNEPELIGNNLEEALNYLMTQEVRKELLQ